MKIMQRSDDASDNPNDQLSTKTNEWLTAEEAAQYLKAKRRTVLSWVRQGRIKGFALSGTKRHLWRFLRKDLDAALRISHAKLHSAVCARIERSENETSTAQTR